MIIEHRYKTLFTFFVFAFILVFPKIAVMSVPGTYIGIRGEDLLIGIAFAAFYLWRTAFKHAEMDVDKDTSQLVKAMAVYLFVCAISTFYGTWRGYMEQPLLGAMFWFRKFEYMFLALLGYYVFRSLRGASNIVIRITHVCTAIIIGVGLLQLGGYVGGWAMGTYRSLIEMAEFRIMSVFSGPYEYGAYLVMITPLYLFRSLRGNNKLAHFAVLIMIAASLYFTQARVALVAFIVVVFLMLFRSRRWPLVILLSLGILIGAVMVPFGKGVVPLPERFSSVNPVPMMQEFEYRWQHRDFDLYLKYGALLDFSQTSDVSWSYRMSKWANILDGFMKNPVFGVGLSVTNEAVDGNYIRYLAESGLVGFISWLLLMSLVWRRTKTKCADPQDELIRLMVRYGVFGLAIQATLIDIFEASKIAMMLWFLVGALYAIQREEVQSDAALLRSPTES